MDYRDALLVFMGEVTSPLINHTTQIQTVRGYNLIMEYGSTLYVEMAPKKMVSPLNVYKMKCSELCCRCSLGLI